MRRLSVIACAGLCLLLSACGSRINEVNFDKIGNGMSKDEVRAILGDPSRTEAAGIPGFSGASMSWEDDGTVITVQFINDKVFLKNLAKKDG